MLFIFSIFMKSVFSRFSPFIVAPVLAGSVLLFSDIPRASAVVPPDVTTSVNNTKDVVEALSPIALAAISVSLVPFGAGMAVSIQLMSPASGDSQLKLIQPAIIKRFHSINVPSEWGLKGGKVLEPSCGTGFPFN